MFAVVSLRTAIVILLTLVLGGAPGRGQDEPSGFVRILHIDSQRNFPDAAAPRAIALACTNTPEILPAFFRRRRLPFDPNLVYALPEFAACHIYYEPSLPGFRAARDDSPIEGLYVAVDPLNFFADADFAGSSLHIAKTVLGRLPRSVDVRINVSGGFDKSLWEPTAAYHFGGTAHRMQFFHSGLLQAHPWTQDHLKSGFVNGQRRILIPRRLFEGKEPDGAAYETLLKRMKAPDVVQSKLSWEGGDIQFVASPNDPAKTILAHGAGDSTSRPKSTATSSRPSSAPTTFSTSAVSVPTPITSSVSCPPIARRSSLSSCTATPPSPAPPHSNSRSLSAPRFPRLSGASPRRPLIGNQAPAPATTCCTRFIQRAPFSTICRLNPTSKSANRSTGTSPLTAPASPKIASMPPERRA